MEHIKVRKKISRSVILYILIFMIIIPYFSFQRIHIHKYMELKDRIEDSIDAGDFTNAEVLLEAIFATETSLGAISAIPLRSEKNFFLLYLKLLQERDKKKQSRKNAQQMIQICRFMEHHFFLTPKAVRFTLIKAYYLMGNHYYPQAIREIHLLGIKKFLKLTEVEEQMMASEMYFFKKDWKRALLIVDHLLKKEPDNHFFQARQAQIFMAMGEKSKARSILKEIVLKHPLDSELREAILKLLALTEDLMLYSEADFLYSYIIEKNDFDMQFMVEYIKYLLRHNQRRRARSFLAGVETHIGDKKKFKEMKKLLF